VLKSFLTTLTPSSDKSGWINAVRGTALVRKPNRPVDFDSWPDIEALRVRAAPIIEAAAPFPGKECRDETDGEAAGFSPLTLRGMEKAGGSIFGAGSTGSPGLRRGANLGSRFSWVILKLRSSFIPTKLWPTLNNLDKLIRV
jgi:hypothetical protein